MHFSLATTSKARGKAGRFVTALGVGASYQGDPGTGVEATGLLPRAALSSPVTRIDGGAFQQKEKKNAVSCFCLNTHLQGRATKQRVTSPCRQQ